MQNKKENAIFYIVDLLVLGRNILILIVIFLKKNIFFNIFCFGIPKFPILYI